MSTNNKITTKYLISAIYRTTEWKWLQNVIAEELLTFEPYDTELQSNSIVYSHDEKRIQQEAYWLINNLLTHC